MHLTPSRHPLACVHGLLGNAPPCFDSAPPFPPMMHVHSICMLHAHSSRPNIAFLTRPLSTPHSAPRAAEAIKHQVKGAKLLVWHVDMANFQ